MLTILMSLAVAAAFPIGALSSLHIKYPTRLKADLASFSAGIFLAAVTFSIIEEAVKLGNVPTTAIGFAIGALTFSIVRYYIQKKQRSNSGNNSSHNNKGSREGNSSSDGGNDRGSRDGGGGVGAKAVIIG